MTMWVMRLRTILLIGTALNTLLGPVFLYKLAFSFWMTAHPVYQSDWWKHRFYVNLAMTLVIAMIQVLLLRKLFAPDKR